MSRWIQVAACAVALVALAASTRAARNLDGAVLSAANVEIVVVEVDGCLYCQIFRRDVLPSYERSARARSVPMRFVDLNDQDFAALALEAPVANVPTIVVLKDSREVGRIDGYVGPENFFHAINRLLTAAE